MSNRLRILAKLRKWYRLFEKVYLYFGAVVLGVLIVIQILSLIFGGGEPSDWCWTPICQVIGN